MAAHGAIDNVGQPLSVERPAHGGQMVDKDMTVEVFVFVLDDSCGKVMQQLVVLLSLLVLILHANATIAGHLFAQAGQAEATFLRPHLLTAVLNDGGIDQHAFEVFALLVVATERLAVEHNQAQGAADLRSGETYTSGMIHRFKHIGDQCLQVRKIVRQRLGYFPQNGMSV